MQLAHYLALTLDHFIRILVILLVVDYCLHPTDFSFARFWKLGLRALASLIAERLVVDEKATIPQLHWVRRATVNASLALAERFLPHAHEWVETVRATPRTPNNIITPRVGRHHDARGTAGPSHVHT